MSIDDVLANIAAMPTTRTKLLALKALVDAQLVEDEHNPGLKIVSCALGDLIEHEAAERIVTEAFTVQGKSDD